MHIAICIVSYRSRNDIVRCLSALGDSRYADFSIIICENGGEAAGSQLRELRPVLPGGQPVRIIVAEGNLGFAGGVNRCIEATPDADAWWILNPDTEPEPAALAEMVARLARGDCDAVGCVLGLERDRIQSYGGLWRKQLARAVSIGHGHRRDPHAVDAPAIEARQNYLNGASMLVSRRFVEAAGLMREDYFLYCEEVEWCLRARRRGMRLGFAPRAFVLHHQGTSTGNVKDLQSRSRLSVYLGERNKILLTFDCYSAWLPLASLAALALILLRFGRARAWTQMTYALEGWIAGLRGLRGAPSD